MNEKIFYNLKKNCTEIIHFYKKYEMFIFSGKDESSEIFYKDYPVKRFPKHTSFVFHKYINFLFEKSGFAVNRSNCFFGSGDKNVAKKFGNIYVIFPKNGFEILWSKYVYDLYENMNQFSEIFFGNEKIVEKIFIFDNNFYIVFSDVNKLCNEMLFYLKNNIEYIIKEDFIKMKDNLKLGAFENFIFIFNRNFSSVKERDLKNIKKIILKYCKRIDTNNEIIKIKKIYNDNDLLDAVKSKNEIMIGGIGGCYFVNPLLAKNILFN